jgi:Zn finger protein HypA/HybF involved in hydrogenase expression
MSPQEIQHIDLFVEETKDKLPTEFAGMKVEFQCLECHRESKDVDFHFYLKCQHCGTYNTKM